MDMKIKDVIAVVLVLGGIIGVIVCAITALVFYFQNPDMTALRRSMEFPWPTIGALISFIATEVGVQLANDRRK
jgi:hypothetical protein